MTALIIRLWPVFSLVVSVTDFLPSCSWGSRCLSASDKNKQAFQVIAAQLNIASGLFAWQDYTASHCAWLSSSRLWSKAGVSVFKRAHIEPLLVLTSVWSSFRPGEVKQSWQLLFMGFSLLNTNYSCYNFVLFFLIIVRHFTHQNLCVSGPVPK